MIMAVTLSWFAAGLTDRVFECGGGLLLWGRGASHVEDFLLDDGAVKVVHAVTQRYLREREPHAHPVRGEMVDVVQIDAADSKIAQLLERRRGFDVGENRGLWFESEWHKAGEAAGFILQLAKLPQMIDAVGECLDVAVEHGAGAAAPHVVPGAMDLEPFFCALIASTNLIAHSRIENFRAAPGD